MKIYIISALLILVFAQSGLAQFVEGESFISGGFSNNLLNQRKKSDPGATRYYNHNLNVGFGKSVKANKAVGWGINHSLTRQKFSSPLDYRKPLSEFSFGVSRFAEFYKPLNDKFSLFVSPSVGLTYDLENSYNATESTSYTESNIHTVTLGINLSAGAAWRFAPKWALYGYFAFINPINVSFKSGKSKYVNVQSPEYDSASEGRGIEYAFRPDLSSGSIGLGFRYIWGGN